MGISAHLEVSSWPVYGLFQNLSIALVGTEQRAGAMSDLLFDFTPRCSAQNSRDIGMYSGEHGKKVPFDIPLINYMFNRQVNDKWQCPIAM